MKNPLTLAGIEPTTFRFVAQHLNHCATAVPIALYIHYLSWIWCVFVRASLYKRREENRLGATEWFIALIICSTCFGHLYAHHQELETVLVLLPYMVCNVRDEGSYSSSFLHPGRIAYWPAPDRRPPPTKTLHTICGNNTSIVSSSWWWAYKCPKHVEQIITAINLSVASSWVSSLHLLPMFFI